MITGYTKVLRNYAVFRGRASLSEFWRFTLAQVFICVAVSSLSAAIHDWLLWIWFLYFLRHAPTVVGSMRS